MSAANKHRCFASEPLWFGGVDEKNVGYDMQKEGVPFLTLVSAFSYAKWETGPKMHVHRGCLELSFCDRGAMQLEDVSVKRRILPGMVFAMPSDRPHHYLDTPNGAHIYTALIPLTKNTARLKGLPKQEGKALAGLLKALPPVYRVDRKKVCAAFRRLLETLQNTERSADLRRLHLYVAGIRLLMALTDVRADRSGKDRVCELVRKWMREMERHPERRYDTAKLIAGESVNKQTFLASFREVSGYTPKAYHMRSRIDRARAMLSSGMSVQTTAVALGFCSSQHFATVFKKVAGKRPRDLFCESA